MLYKLDLKNKSSYSKVNRVTLENIGWKEKDLQDLISTHIGDFIHSCELLTIFNERPWQEEPDIMALDRKGDLYIFELKRWSSKKENLLQVLRYGQLYGNSDYEELNELYQKHTADRKPLSEIHSEYFGLSPDNSLEKSEYNNNQHFLIVTNGLDQETVSSIQYWKNKGLSIDAVIYWVFKIEGEYYIEFNTYSPIKGYLEYESSSYILNTNKSNNPRNTTEMLECQKAAAYYPGWREKIEKLQKDDVVFLYENGKGIIAYGYADGLLKKKDADGYPEYEYYMQLSKFQILTEPISAAEMKSLTKQGFPFRQTLYGISEECKEILMNEISNGHL